MWVVLADVHGNIDALRTVWSRLDDTVEAVLFLGDLAGYYPWVEECRELLCTRDVVGVRGNHDEVLLHCVDQGSVPSPVYEARYGSALRRALESVTADTVGFLRSLPRRRTHAVDGRTVELVHGAPWDPMEGRVYPDFDGWVRFDDIDADAILLGHTHYPLVRTVNGTLVVNPGSVGQPRDRSALASYAVLDPEGPVANIERVAFDPAATIRDAELHDPALPYLVDVFRRS